MKKIAIFVLSLFFMSISARAEQGGIQFVQKLTDDIIVNVLSANIPDEEKLKIFHDRFAADLDISTIGKHITSHFWRKSTPQEQSEFLDAFLDFSTKSWADKFNLYTGQKMEFTGTKAAKSNQFFVTSVVKNNPPVEVIWRLKKTDQTYKITDIIIEGVSMVASYKNEYTTFIHQNGGKLSALTQELKRKSSEFKFTQK